MRMAKQITPATITTCWPEMASTCVIVLVCTESRLRFRATLGEEPEVEVALS